MIISKGKDIFLIFDRYYISHNHTDVNSKLQKNKIHEKIKSYLFHIFPIFKIWIKRVFCLFSENVNNGVWSVIETKVKRSTSYLYTQEVKKNSIWLEKKSIFSYFAS